jgi:hypothetical protein
VFGRTDDVENYLKRSYIINVLGFMLLVKGVIDEVVKHPPLSTFPIFQLSFLLP